MFWTILLQIVLIFLNAIFASAEMAIVSVSETKIQKLADEGNKSAKRILTLTAQPARFLSTIQVAITLAGFLGSAFAADNFAKPLVGVIMQTGIPLPEGVVNSICVVVITLILAYFNIVFGELIPKRIAMKKAEGREAVLFRLHNNTDAAVETALTVNEATLPLSFGAYEVKTVLLENGRLEESAALLI